MLEVVLVAEVALLLASAFRKLLLNEEAYGFTVARLWGKGFMIVLALSLVALAIELRGTFDLHRLVRRQAALGAALLLSLTYWNHEAWITERNIARFEQIGRLDLRYLAHNLSASAVPQALEAARQGGGIRGICADLRIRERWAHIASGGRAWYEWNAAAARARRALGREPWHTVSPADRAQLRRHGCGVDWSIG
jgi:hypothetical protein